MKINVTRSSMPDFEEYCEEIRELWDTHHLTNMGIKHQTLEKQLTEFFGCGHVTLFTNGHLALEAAIHAFDFPAGSEVITTPFTFISTTHAIVRNGLKPVFCDVNEKDYTIDADQIESLITERTVAIVPVHVYGNLCDVEKIAAIAEKHNLKVIYDAAHAFGVKYKGISSGCFGDASMFSFHATKVFNTIEGGAVSFADDSLIQKLNDAKNFGIHGTEDCWAVGGNAKMNEFQAAMGICNLRHFSEEVAKRKTVAERYDSHLKGIAGITVNEIQKDVQPNYCYYPVFFSGYRYSRDEVFQKLRENDFGARKYFYPLTTDMTCYKDIYDSSQTPAARKLAGQVLTLPMYADLPLETVDEICRIITG